MATSIPEGSTDDQEASIDALRDDDAAPSIATISASIRARSEPEGESSDHARGDRENPALPGPFARSSD